MATDPIERRTAATATLATGPRFHALPPLSLYIHVPWCVRKCPYCDFNSHEARGDIPETAYVAALIADLEHAIPLVWGRRVQSVFFGGGTPSLLSGAAVETLLSAVRARIPLAVDAEVTLEANPGTFESGKFGAYRAAGVNRLSIGIQSFDPAHLASLGRIHDDVQAAHAIDIARQHFENFNLDLMYGLPRQTIAQAEADVSRALAYAPPHLSFYHLTIEPNTYFHRHPPVVPDDDTAAGMQEMIEKLTADAGYEHYETSAYSLRGRKSRHNLNYWTYGDYLGVGAGAHSKISFSSRIVRQARHRSPRDYMARTAAGNAVQSEHEVAARDIPFEFMMNVLRLSDGFPSSLFPERAGLPVVTVLRTLDEAERRGFVSRDHERVVPTDRGRRFLNDLLQLFLPSG